MGKELHNKPLVEAILEIKWALQGSEKEPKIDPFFKILLGRFYDRIISDYPEHEQLPTANLPDEIVGQMVQHRFRIGKEQWPLVQLGPGIFTFNSTADYKWSDFKERSILVVKKLFEAHPRIEQFKVTSIVLRYINAVGFENGNNDIFNFISENLKISLALPDNLFENNIENKPLSMSFQSSFKSSSPSGTISIRVTNGQKEGLPVIIWETALKTSDGDLPNLPSEFESWIDAAHQNTDDWFFKMIEGKLERRFSKNGADDNGKDY
jgi:uncharacterized protein (TIGR04255 family)